MAGKRNGLNHNHADESAEAMQKRLRQKRESITQQVEEIKMVMHAGIQDTKDKVTESLDLRMQMQRYPLATIAGAITLGFVAGQVLGRIIGPNEEMGAERSVRTLGAGSSLGPDMSVSRRERHFVPPALKSKVTGGLEDTLCQIADNLFAELSRVGQEVIVPTIVSNLTNAFTRDHTSDASSDASYSPRSARESSLGQTVAGGPISSDDPQTGAPFQGRSI